MGKNFSGAVTKLDNERIKSGTMNTLPIKNPSAYVGEFFFELNRDFVLEVGEFFIANATHIFNFVD